MISLCKLTKFISNSKVKIIGIFTVLVLICLSLCACTESGSYSDDKVQEREVGSVSYPVNENGQTYGSSADAYRNLPEGISSNSVIDYLPDLVLVANDEGTEGYVLKTDYLPTMPNNPEEAQSLAESATDQSNEVPMYDSDGETVLGTWKAPVVTVE